MSAPPKLTARNPGNAPETSRFLRSGRGIPRGPGNRQLHLGHCRGDFAPVGPASVLLFRAVDRLDGFKFKYVIFKV